MTASSSGSSAANGWKTYTSQNWHIALDYPPDWSVREESGGTTFTAPSGAAIHLSLVEQSNELNDLPNTRCTTQTNSHGLQTRVCLDTIARSYQAFLGSGTKVPVLTLGTRPPVDLTVFNAMVASARSAP